jgi:hypothetical protein
MSRYFSVAPSTHTTRQVEIDLRNCVSDPFPLADEGITNLPAVQTLRTVHCSAWRLNDLGVWSGEELAFVAVIPAHSVVLSGSPSHHLQDLPAPPGGVDRDRLDDDPISLVCMHKALNLSVLGLAPWGSAPNVELLAAFWVFMGVKVKVRSVVSLQYLEDST